MDLESLAEFIRMHKESLERDKRELEVINRLNVMAMKFTV